MATTPPPAPEVTTSETTMLDTVLALEPDYYKRGPGYEWSNGRKFEEGLGPYGA